MPTSRLGLPTPAGTALISTGDNDITSLANVLDRSALWLVPGTFAARPAASGNDGRFYLATDVGIIYVSDGTNWIEVSRGGGIPPIGAMMDYTGSADPADTRWVIADGRAISRTTFAAAFAIMGTAYGSGNGSTTFNIPDARGRTTVGADAGAGRMASNNTRGASGGTETKTLVEANLPAHTHGVGTLATSSAGSHDHSVGTLAVVSDGAHVHGVGTLANATTGTHSHGGVTSGASADHTHGMTHDHALQMGNDYPGTGTIPAPDNNVAFDAGGGGAGSPIKTFFGNTGGMSAQHVHTITSDGSHTHTISGSVASSGAHTHGLSGAVASNGAHTHPVTGATASVGSDTAFNGMPPYLVTNKIVRIS